MGSRRLVASGDVQLCAESFGDPRLPTIVLVSGAAASMDWWETDFCRQLSEGGRHVVRYDHRDTGESTTGPPGQPSYDGWQLARDCVGLVEAVSDEPVHLVGISMGGGIAQWVALRRPDLVASLTLVSTSAVGGVDTSRLPGPTAAVSAAFASPPPEPDWADPDSYADWVVAGARPYAGTLPFDESRMRTLATAVHARSRDPAAHTNHWLAVSGEGEDDDEPADVRRISVSTLVVHGSADPFFPLPHAQALAEAIPGATLLVLEGVGHQEPPPQTWDVVVPALLRHTETA
jgi:pimeloyl-ACP methyl ester carboxylesterase